MEIYTAGFTQWTARDFFAALNSAGVKRILDVRLNNTSQLSAFAKRDDLAFFAHELLGAEYLHAPFLAPTQDMLKAYRAKQLSWSEYEEQFVDLIRARAVEDELDRDEFAVRTVLLCSEHAADCCHRRLVAEHLAESWGNLDVVHLQ